MDYEMVPNEEDLHDLDHGPTFEDLAIDDSLSDLDRVTKYVCSNIALQRVIHVKMLQETAHAVGFEATCVSLLPLLEPLVVDLEYVVRQHVAFQFPALCAFLVDAGKDAGYRLLLDQMIPLIARLVSDEQHEVRTAASDSLVEMAALVHPEDQGTHILTIVLPLAHDDDNEQFRISAVNLYNGLAEHFGPELCQQFCVPELISLSEDPVFRVRKSTAQSYSNVCKTAGYELSRERMVPSFQRLAHDDIWGVRKACAECLVPLAQALALEDRGPLLIPLFEAFVNDSSRWVRMAAYQSLGSFLATLDPEDVNDELIDYYLSMASASSMQLGGSSEADIKFHCAFNFPAVVSILGGASGWSRLAPAFELLSSDSYWKIRRTLAYSLHELAKLLGQEITETQLATVFDSYLHDSQEVKLGAMLHFADFLEQVSPSFRESYLPVLTGLEAHDQRTKWRFREVMSQQLAQLCRTFTADATFAVIYPLVFKLITDEVAVVRQESYHACPLLVQRLSIKTEWLTAVIEKFTSLATSSHNVDRQGFLKICRAFLIYPEDGKLELKPEATASATEEIPAASCGQAFFNTHFAPAFFTLANDPVSNVRLLFAQILLEYQDVLQANDRCPDHLKELLSKTLTTQSAETLVAALDVVRAAEEAAAKASEPDVAISTEDIAVTVTTPTEEIPAPTEETPAPTEEAPAPGSDPPAPAQPEVTESTGTTVDPVA